MDVKILGRLLSDGAAADYNQWKQMEGKQTNYKQEGYLCVYTSGFINVFQETKRKFAWLFKKTTRMQYS